jgi:ABC-type sugar transport system ATPase subunit
VAVVLRPEHIGHSPAGIAATGNGTVRLLENLGGESVVYFAVGEETLVTTVPSPSVADLDLGADFPFFLRPEGMLVFDRASGARVGRGNA